MVERSSTSRQRKCVYIPSEPLALGPFESNVTLKENFNFGIALESIYDLLPMIFRFLSIEDLKNVSKVRPTWSIFVKKEIKRRNDLTWLRIAHSEGENRGVVSKSSQFSFHNVSLAIVIKKGISFSCYCFHFDTDEKNHIRDSDFFMKYVLQPKANYSLIHPPFFKSIHPETPDLVKPMMALYDILMIPFIPNIKVNKFLYKPTKRHPTIPLHTKNHETIRCILIFTCLTEEFPHRSGGTDILPVDLLGKIALGGGMMSDKITLYDGRNCSKASNMCIAFIEDHRKESIFSATSVVIEPDASIKDVQRLLSNFKKNCTLRQNSIGFIFGCKAKEDHELESEAQIIKKLFPKTHLYQFYVHGEIGWDYDDSDYRKDEDEIPYKMSKLASDVVYHEYTTIFVLISWGRIIEGQNIIRFRNSVYTGSCAIIDSSTIWKCCCTNIL